ncbi:MAG TPA: hypothetical protein VGM92_06770 [Candidatus Kapabacteria bacterium]|jgi:hypothetical protein
MDLGYIIQLLLFALLALALLVIVVGAIKAVPRPFKVRSMRYSKRGDGWITKFKRK